MRMFCPWRVELGAESYDQQRREGLNSVDGPTEHLAASRINPMHILEDHQNRLLGCQSNKLRGQGFHCSLPTLLRREIKRGIASVVWQRQQLGQERDILNRGQRLREQRIKLVEFRLG